MPSQSSTTHAPCAVARLLCGVAAVKLLGIALQNIFIKWALITLGADLAVDVSPGLGTTQKGMCSGKSIQWEPLKLWYLQWC